MDALPCRMSDVFSTRSSLSRVKNHNRRPASQGDRCLLLAATCTWSSRTTEEDGGPYEPVSPPIHMKERGWSALCCCSGTLVPESQLHHLLPRRHRTLGASSGHRRLGDLGAASCFCSSATSCTPDMLGVKTNSVNNHLSGLERRLRG